MNQYHEIKEIIKRIMYIYCWYTYAKSGLKQHLLMIIDYIKAKFMKYINRHKTTSFDDNINELLIIKPITANENNYYLQLNFKGSN